MSRYSLILNLFLASPLLAQEANEILFTLVSEEGFNEMEVTAAVPLLGGSEDTSTLTGTLNAILNIDEFTNQTDTLTFVQADLEGTDVTLANTNIFGSYSVSAEGLEADVVTPNPPGIVTPASGEFAANQHNFIVNEGTISGSANDNAIEDFDFSSAPFEGMATGTGTIVIIATTKTVDRQYYDVSFTNPVFITDSIETGVLNITADVTMDATLKASGTTFIERSAYAAWAGTNLDPSDKPDDNSLDPSIPNGLIYALGFDANNAPQDIFSPNGAGFQLQLAGTGTREELLIEWSTDLVSWEAVPMEKMLQGNSSIIIGSSEPAIVGPGDEASRFYRVRIICE